MFLHCSYTDKILKTHKYFNLYLTFKKTPQNFKVLQALEKSQKDFQPQLGIEGKYTNSDNFYRAPKENSQFF